MYKEIAISWNSICVWGLRRHLGGLSPPKPKPGYVTDNRTTLCIKQISNNNYYNSNNTLCPNEIGPKTNSYNSTKTYQFYLTF